MSDVEAAIEPEMANVLLDDWMFLNKWGVALYHSSFHEANKVFLY